MPDTPHISELSVGDLVSLHYDGMIFGALVTEVHDSWTGVAHLLVGDETVKLTMYSEHETESTHTWLILYLGGGTEIERMEILCKA